MLLYLLLLVIGTVFTSHCKYRYLYPYLLLQTSLFFVSKPHESCDYQFTTTNDDLQQRHLQQRNMFRQSMKYLYHHHHGNQFMFKSSATVMMNARRSISSIEFQLSDAANKTPDTTRSHHFSCTLTKDHYNFWCFNRDRISGSPHNIWKRSFSTSSLSSSEENLLSSSANPPAFQISRRSGVRNVAIVAHVDHGKTTLVDELLKSVSEEGGNRLMDSGELEKERGITITSKVTRLEWNNFIYNVVDTPGHADFAGEVDRILGMVDGVCLVVDASEGPMAQTKYVLSRALQQGLLPIVLLNKVDRPDALSKIQSGETESKLLDLFDSLGASDEQMDYVTLYASAREGWVTHDAQIASELALKQRDKDESVNMHVVLNAILDHIPEPKIHCYSQDLNPNQDLFSLAATTVGMDAYQGRTCTGRIYSGTIQANDEIIVLRRDGSEILSNSTVLADVCVNRGISRVPLRPPVASAGDIVTLVGVPDSIAVGDTVTFKNNPVPHPIQTLPLAPPTLSMDFGCNNGPLAGKEGTILTSSRIRSRLHAETDNNVTISIQNSETDSDKTTVFGRGELQLGILIEQMRREGFELVISPPRILTKTDPETGKKLEPFEEVTVDVDSEFSGIVIDSLTSIRKGVLIDMQENPNDGKTRLLFEVPSRGLLGFGPEIATQTRGTAVVNHCYLEDREYAGVMGDGTEKGKLVASEGGKVSAYALSSVVERGKLFIEPGDVVYAGMVVGESTRSGALEVNPVRSKQLTNMRAAGKDEKIYLPPPKRWTVEELIGYMNDDEVIEVTPLTVRLRKAELDAGVRERAARSRKKQLKSILSNHNKK
jgi:GTP-binding protein